jgi:hypothetical protein
MEQALTEGPSEKACSKCREIKSATRDYFDWSQRDGLTADCKICRRKSGKCHRIRTYERGQHLTSEAIH